MRQLDADYLGVAIRDALVATMPDDDVAIFEASRAIRVNGIIDLTAVAMRVRARIEAAGVGGFAGVRRRQTYDEAVPVVTASAGLEVAAFRCDAPPNRSDRNRRRPDMISCS